MKKFLFLTIIIITFLSGCDKTSLLEIHIIDVGQGDSILIKTPNKKTILVDGGDENSSLIIKKFLKYKKVNKIDFIIATHPDTDHIGSLDSIINKFNVSDLYMPDLQVDSTSYYNMLKACKDNNLSPKFLSKGNIIELDNNIKITILSPSYTHSDNNSNSIVFKLDYKDKSFLFTGDCTEINEMEIIRSYNLEEVDFLKVAHHGSKNSSSIEFLKETSPDVAAISCGYRNQYGHPHEETLNRLSQENILVYRTDEQSHLSFYSNGLTITTSNKIK